jgi:hypothetical protein
MAEPTARPTAAEWDPREYAFDPYGLTAERLSPEGSKPSTSSAAGSDDHTSKEGAGPPDQPVKRRPGRQKRTSVLCQVCYCPHPSLCHVHVALLWLTPRHPAQQLQPVFCRQPQPLVGAGTALRRGADQCQKILPPVPHLPATL